MAIDGRVVDSDTNTILSDGEKKFAICGSVTVLIAGTFGRIWTQLQATPPRSYAGFRSFLTEHSTDDTEWLVYCRKSDRLFLGDVMVSRSIAGIGCGSPFGLGAL